MPQRFCLVEGHIVLEDRLLEGGCLIIADGRIEHIGPTPPDASIPRIDARGCYIAPGYIDIHVHGGQGADFMDGTVDAILRACGAHLQHGTTTIFPTTTTGSAERIRGMLQACAAAQSAIRSDRSQGAMIAGVHLYGPYFAPDKVGCHAPAGCRAPVAEEYDAYFASGIVKIATCAAELPGAEAFYRRGRDAGCLLTCGHSNASWSEMVVAHAAGVTHVDHFWCAMSSVGSLRQRFGVPMQASMAEFVLAHPQMTTEVIADGCHLAPELLQFAYQMIGPDRLCLVTDCNRALDMPPGQYRFGHLAEGSLLWSDGEVGWSTDRSSLASSVRGMDHMVRHMVQHTSATLPEAIRMASLTPARLTGIDDRVGSLQPGKEADLVLLNADLEVEQVFAAGQPVYEAN
ncbi:MAG: N-acetylglucosamine-6-phosphate deacetylase [Planctomycetota bacterium]|nr:MAG: N-acetylglucosamine-6-phosphate deacetylase [Planctomycetota bacterium]